MTDENEDAKKDDDSVIDPVDEKNDDGDEKIVFSKSKMELIFKLLKNIKENTERVKDLMTVAGVDIDLDRMSFSQGECTFSGDKEGSVKIIEGVFDGENMIGPDGKQYGVPANYASKSKLVEGDILKLSIAEQGAFVYKQISPIDRRRIVGKLEKTGDGAFYVAAEGKMWRVLPASVTYYRGDSGDEAVIFVPKEGESRWAAVENVVRKS